MKSRSLHTPRPFILSVISPGWDWLVLTNYWCLPQTGVRSPHLELTRINYQRLADTYTSPSILCSGLGWPGCNWCPMLTARMRRMRRVGPGPLSPAMLVCVSHSQPWWWLGHLHDSTEDWGRTAQVWISDVQHQESRVTVTVSVSSPAEINISASHSADVAKNSASPLSLSLVTTGQNSLTGRGRWYWWWRGRPLTGGGCLTLHWLPGSKVAWHTTTTTTSTVQTSSTVSPLTVMYV